MHHNNAILILCNPVLFGYAAEIRRGSLLVAHCSSQLGVLLGCLGVQVRWQLVQQRLVPCTTEVADILIQHFTNYTVAGMTTGGMLTLQIQDRGRRTALTKLFTLWWDPRTRRWRPDSLRLQFDCSWQLMILEMDEGDFVHLSFELTLPQGDVRVLGKYPTRHGFSSME